MLQKRCPDGQGTHAYRHTGTQKQHQPHKGLIIDAPPNQHASTPQPSCCSACMSKDWHCCRLRGRVLHRPAWRPMRSNFPPEPTLHITNHTMPWHVVQHACHLLSRVSGQQARVECGFTGEEGDGSAMRLRRREIKRCLDTNSRSVKGKEGVGWAQID